MKISDPLGKVYTHTMFKKKSYDIPRNEVEQDEQDQDESDEDAISEVSEQSDDSISTRSSRIVPSRRGSSRHHKDDVEQQDREDAISYASRHKDARGRKDKKFGLENLGPPGTSYSLWSTQRSLQRDHRRKFNRSLCGVLLGIRKV